MPSEPTFIPAEEPLIPEINPLDAQIFRTIGANYPLPDPVPTPEPEPLPDPGSPDPAAPAPAPEPAAPAAPAPPSEPAAAPTPAPAPAAPPASPSPAAPAPAPTPKGRNRLDRIEDAVAKLADAVSAPPAAPAPAPAPPPGPTVEPKLALRLEAVTQVAGPQAAKKYEEFVQKDSAFRKKWEVDNPGKRFDADSDEYLAFRETHEPDIPAEDIIRAEATIAATREVEKKFEERLAQERSSVIREQVEVEARRAAAAAPAAIAEGLDTNDKFVAHAAKVHAQEAGVALREVHRLFTPGVTPQFDGNNPIQRALVETVAKYDALYAKMDPAETTFDGRQFVPAAQFNRIPAKDRGNYWTLAQEPHLVASVVAASFKERVKSTAETLRREFGTPAPAPVPAPAPAPTPAPGPIVIPATPPAGGAGPGSAPSGTPGVSSQVDYFGR